MDQCPFCLRADCRWMFNEQMICLPETDENTFKVEIGIYVPLQGSAFICGCVLPTPVPGRGKESGGNRKVAGLCEMSWCLELQWNWHKPDSSAHPIHLDTHWERASGKRTATWCPASGWYLLNHIEALKSKPRRKSSGVFPSKDGKAPQNPPPPPGTVRALEGPPVLLTSCCSISRWMHCGDWGTTPHGKAPLLRFEGFTLCLRFGSGGRNWCRSSQDDPSHSELHAERRVLVMIQVHRACSCSVELSVVLAFRDLSEAEWKLRGKKASRHRARELTGQSFW